MLRLIDKKNHDWSKAYRLEAIFNHIFNEQYNYGCKIDTVLMDKLLVDIAVLIEEFKEKVLNEVPGKLKFKLKPGTTIKMNVASGAYSSRFLKFADSAELSLDQVVGDLTPVEFEPLNLESPKQRNECLLKMGWVPTEFNYKETLDGRPYYDDKGNKVIQSPKLTEDSVSYLPAGQFMLRYLVYSHKFKLVTGLKKLLRENGTIGAGGISCGTNTARAIHRGVVNIPRVGDDFGTELRSLFTVRPGKVLLGADLSALENRLAGHFTYGFDNGVYAKRLMEEDPHDNTSRLFGNIGLPIDRGTAKTCVPLTTKALTRRGWKLPNELIIGEDILAYDPVTETKKWTPLLEVTVLKNKEVLTFEDNSWRFEATEDHRWFVNQRKKSNSSRSFVKPYMQKQIRTTAELNSESNLIINAPMDLGEDSIISENTLVYKKYGTNWTQKVLDMSQKERISFLEGFMIADGFESNGSWKWSQNDNEFCEAALTASYLVHSGTINVSLKKNKDKTMKTVLLNKKAHTTFQHKGFVKTGKVCDVWCPTTKFGSWVMRQEDCITITGNCNYALGYGARPEKLQSVLNCPLPLAKQAFDLWWSDRAVMLELQKKLMEALSSRGQLISHTRLAEGAYIIGIDGRKIFVRSTHSLVNSLIQNAGSLIMKFIVCFVYNRIQQQKLDAHFVIQMHDELEIELFEKDFPLVSDFIQEAIISCNNYFKLKIPMAMDIKTGINWSQVH